MKRLIEYILENASNIKSLKSSIIKSINMIDDTVDNDKYEKLLQKINKQLANKDLSIDVIRERLKYVGLEYAEQTIIQKFNSYDNVAEIIQLYTNVDKLPTVDDLLKGNNIYDVILSKCKDINKDLLVDLANLDLSSKNIAKGKFEILTQLFFGDINKNNANYSGKFGDINIGGQSLEYKLSGGALKGHNTIKSPKSIYKNFKRICLDAISVKDKTDETQLKQSSLIRLWNSDELNSSLDAALLDNDFSTYVRNNSDNFLQNISNYNNFINGFAEFNLEDDFINHILALSILHQLPKDKFELDNATHKEIINNFCEFVQKMKPVNNKQPNIKAMKYILLVFHMWFYHYIEKFDNIIIFSKDSKSTINGNYVVINNENFDSFDKLYQICKDKKIGIDNLIFANNPRAYATTVKYIKK